MLRTILPSLVLCVSVSAMSSRLAAQVNEAGIEVVTKTPGLVAFWTFGEEGGESRRSVGTASPYPLREVGGPIPRVEGGPFSGYSAKLNGQQYLHVIREELGALDISGPEAQVSMFAVVNIDEVERSRTIAGIWTEGGGAWDDRGTRQYSMLVHMPMYGGARRVVPHISAEGGVTRRGDGSRLPWNADYAAPVSEIPEKRWVTLGFTYDGKYIRAYQDGVMEPREMDAAADNRNDPYFTSEGPDGGPRGMNPYYHGRGIFKYDPALHGQTKLPPPDFTVGARQAAGEMFVDAFRGRFGGLAVFNRALTDEQMKALHDAANLSALE
jgi:hypothetical protein